MPQIISKGTVSNNSGAEIEYEMMRNITYLSKEFYMGFDEIMNLPYAVFLSYLKYMQLFKLESTEEGRKALKDAEMINKTDADLTRFRQQI